MKEDANSEETAGNYTRLKNAKTSWKEDAAQEDTAKRRIIQRKKGKWKLKKKERGWKMIREKQQRREKQKGTTEN